MLKNCSEEWEENYSENSMKWGVIKDIYNTVFIMKNYPWFAEIGLLAILAKKKIAEIQFKWTQRYFTVVLSLSTMERSEKAW